MEGLADLRVELPSVLLQDAPDQAHLAIVGRQNGRARSISSLHERHHGPACRKAVDDSHSGDNGFGRLRCVA